MINLPSRDITQLYDPDAGSDAASGAAARL